MAEQTSPTASAPLQRTPLYERLHQYPARWVPFAGWEMPVEFAGILKEHKQVREGVGLFDLTHMGELEVRAASPQGAVAAVQALVTNDVARLELGAALYTCMCNDEGGVVDDVLVYRVRDGINLVVNASNKDKVLAWCRARIEAGVEVIDRSDETVLIAIQGPRTAEVLRGITSFDVDAVGYYRFVEEASVAGIPCLASRTGYTGEDGFELYVHPTHAVALWDALCAAGEAAGIAPIGLGARDTLRLEARYALYGNDIDDTTNPLEAGLGWVVKPAKGDFVGRAAIEALRAAGLRRTLVGLCMEDRGVPRHGFEVQHAGRTVGVVTSGSYSPTLEQAIALAYIEKSDANLHVVGAELDVIIRNRPCRARVVKTPFHRGSVKS